MIGKESSTRNNESKGMTLISVKVSQKAFNHASASGSVVGLWEGKADCWMHVTLGEEFEYIDRPKDDSHTEFRIFRGCTVSVAESEEDLRAGIVTTANPNQTVRIYY